ncbi:DUF1947 domain-containing protein [Methanobrevibacter filiformis]|uniref:H/ACA RNA-protein complex component Cbf5p n=1 Tax=Methanobrevibacter filiformis TaxID=55758 RepID=A0A166DSA8_9EURY|nr:RNA-binding protein [Methanobrevibacter filiformis]KZX15901.1 H/ACA RNA-protein complex component Cbf5p [Methanobrevibacter filiformis]
MKVKNRYYLKKKKLKEIKKDLKEYSSILPEKAKVEYIDVDPYPFILIDGKPNIILINDKPYPTLKAVLSKDINMKQVVVDMGAVKFMVNGADVMSPGIVDTSDDIKEGDTVLIVDETHKKPLAIGISLISGENMVENTSGKAVNTIHFIGDDIWNMSV